MLAQEARQQIADLTVVVDNQNLRGVHHGTIVMGTRRTIRKKGIVTVGYRSRFLVIACYQLQPRLTSSRYSGWLDPSIGIHAQNPQDEEIYNGQQQEPEKK